MDYHGISRFIYSINLSSWSSSNLHQLRIARPRRVEPALLLVGWAYKTTSDAVVSTGDLRGFNREDMPIQWLLNGQLLWLWVIQWKFY